MGHETNTPQGRYAGAATPGGWFNGRALRAVVWLTLNSQLGFSAARWRYFRQRREIWRLLLYLMLIPAAVPLLLAFYKLWSTALGVLAPAGQGSFVLFLGFMVTQALTFFFAFVYLSAALYFSRDLPRLLPLPLHPYTVLTAKFLSVGIIEYLTALPLFAPLVWAYWQHAGGGALSPLFWLCALLVFLLLPWFPLALAGLVVIPAMRVTNLSRYQGSLYFLFSIVMVGVALGFQYLINATLTRQAPQELLQALLRPGGLVALLSRYYPPAHWAATALTQPGVGGLVALFWLCLSVAVAFGLLLVVGERLFYQGVISGQEVGTRKERRTEVALAQEWTRVRSPLSALLWREQALWRRHPVFFTQGLLNVVFLPLMLFFPRLFTQGHGELAGLLAMLTSLPRLGLVAALLGAGVVALTPSFSLLTSTAVSREGGLFWLSRRLPLSPSLQVRAKILHNTLITVVIGVPIVLALRFLLPVAWAWTILAYGLGLLLSLPAVELNLLVDYWGPKLAWSNPHEAMKGNLNGLFGMLLGIGYLAGLFFLVRFAWRQAWSAGIVLGGLVLLGAGLTLALYPLLLKAAGKLYLIGVEE